MAGRRARRGEPDADASRSRIARRVLSSVPVDAFEDFYRRRAGDVRRYAAAIVGPGDADDACQDAWLRIWQAWDRADPDRRDAWAFRVVRNCCLDRHRRHRPTDALDDAHLPPLAAIDDAVHVRLEADAALGALARLPLPLREALWLREVGELSYAEIAEVQHVPIGTVMSRLHSARAKVARQLRAEGR